jgi:hypothetical protein
MSKPLSHNSTIIQKEQTEWDNTNQKIKKNITSNITWLYTTITNYRKMKKNTHINHTGFCLHLHGLLPCNANLHTEIGIHTNSKKWWYKLKMLMHLFFSPRMLCILLNSHFFTQDCQHSHTYADKHLKKHGNVWTCTCISGISNRPLTSLDPGGSGNPLPRSHLTLALSGPSSRHWKTTSRSMLKKEICQQQL